MLARTKALTWLAENVEKDKGSSTYTEDMNLAYHAYCSKNGIEPANKRVFRTLIGGVYGVCLPRGKHRYIYQGLKLIENTSEERLGLSEFCDAEYVGDDILVPTLAIVNDKILKFRISPTQEKIKVFLRGKEIDVEDIGFCTQSTPENIRTLVKFAPKIQMCQGKEFDISLVTPLCLIERLHFKDGDPANIKIVRGKKCSQVLSYLTTSKLCYRCYMYFHIRKKAGIECEDESDEEQQKTEYDEDDVIPVGKKARRDPPEALLEYQQAICSILNQLNPTPPTECPCDILLSPLRKCIVDKDPMPQKWDRSTVSACLTLWGRLPKAYEDLQENSLLYIPSIQFLENYKNYAIQRPGFNLEHLERMAREAERKQLAESGQTGSQVSDELALFLEAQSNWKVGESEAVHSSGECSQEPVERVWHVNEGIYPHPPVDNQAQYFMRHPGGIEKCVLKCYTCKKPFTSNEEYLYHEISHMYFTWCVCNECPQEFGKKSHLLTHLKKHAIRSKYHCNKCSYDSNSKTKLVDHIHSKHEGSGYRCTFCSVKLLDEKDILSHLADLHTYRYDDCLMQIFLSVGLKNQDTTTAGSEADLAKVTETVKLETEEWAVMNIAENEKIGEMVKTEDEQRNKDVSRTEDEIKEEVGASWEEMPASCQNTRVKEEPSEGDVHE